VPTSTYNATFERECLRGLARAVPLLADALEDIVARLADPLPVMRAHIVHPGFGGSFSLKKVLPVLVPDLAYDDLEIADGGRASRELARVVMGDPSLTPDEAALTREALLRYCERDTLGLARVLDRLRALAASTIQPTSQS
jgi:hypothetical protein